MAVVSLPGRRAGLEFVEKVLTERNGCSAGRSGTRACFAHVPHRASLVELARGRQKKSITKAWPPAASQACAWGMAHIHQPRV